MTVVVPSMIDVWRAADEKRSYAISYADAFAAALAKEHDAELVTGDAEFRSISALKLLWLEAH
jgi:predicted nucleic acid-binding protein